MRLRDDWDMATELDQMAPPPSSHRMQVGEMVVSSLSRTSLEDGLNELHPALYGMAVDDTTRPTLSISLARAVDPPCRTKAKVDENGPSGPSHDLCPDLGPGHDPNPGHDRDRRRRFVPVHTSYRGRVDWKPKRYHQPMIVLPLTETSFHDTDTDTALTCRAKAAAPGAGSWRLRKREPAASRCPSCCCPAGDRPRDDHPAQEGSWAA
ncbi:hypothetical protein JCM24511_06101 [Saitozyma sp. JCM 24511]|nr:hypothetical protein JCM24511_06101 [Saitozyma sp. JCM 24511]